MRSSRWSSRGSTEQPPDEKLVVAFRDGDDSAYGELVQRYQIPLFRLLLGLLAAADDAELLCEDVFVKAARDIEDLQRPGRFYPWLVARSRAAAVLDDDGPKQTQSVDSVEPQDHLQHAVRAALSKMAPDERAVLIFSELQQDSPENIAEALGLELDEVHRLIRRARDRFVANLTTLRGSIDAEAPAPPEAPAELAVGTTVAGRYQIEAVLGSGGMGIVYRANHEGLGRSVALKMLRKQVARVARVRERFRREALVLGKIKHPSFVDVMDFGETDDGLMFIAMEFLEGKSLESQVSAGALKPERALAIAHRVAAGLSHLHAEGLVHRDIKPDNVLLVEHEGEVDFPKILDFGLARFLTVAEETAANPRLTRGHAILGTPAYMAPEQATGADVDGRVDLYALTVALFEMLTGQLPFDAEEPSTMLMMHVSKAPPTLASVTEGWSPSPELEAFVARGLEKEADDRWQSADEYCAELDGFLQKGTPLST